MTWKDQISIFIGATRKLMPGIPIQINYGMYFWTITMAIVRVDHYFKE